MPRLKNKKIVASIQAIAAFAAGILITFSQSHGASIGMIALAIVSVGWAFALGWSAFADKKARGRIYKVTLAVASAVMAGLAIQSFAGLVAFSGQIPLEQNAWAFGLLESWGFAGALAEVILALFAKPGSVRRRDHLISAGLAAAFGLTQFFTPDSDPVTHVGFFGAYAVILSVHLGLSVMSPGNSKPGNSTSSKNKSGKKSGAQKSKSTK